MSCEGQVRARQCGGFARELRNATFVTQPLRAPGAGCVVSWYDARPPPCGNDGSPRRAWSRLALARCLFSQSKLSSAGTGGQSLLLGLPPQNGPRSWGGLSEGRYSPRAFLISPGALSIFRGRPGFWAPASLARGFRVLRVCWARAEREAGFRLPFPLVVPCAFFLLCFLFFSCFFFLLCLPLPLVHFPFSTLWVNRQK